MARHRRALRASRLSEGFRILKERIVIARFHISLTIMFLASSPPAIAQDSAHPAWPPPPERARIVHEQTLTAGTALGRDRGFFGKLLGAIFGGEKTSTWLVQPVGIAVSARGKLYVADPGVRGVHIIDPAKKEYDLITQTKYGPFISPVGCAVDREGRVYVSDSERGEIIVMDDDGDAEVRISGGLGRPTGIQVSGDSLFVADAALHQLSIFTLDGEPRGTVGARGAGASEFNYPVQVAAGESIAVLDALNYRVQTFDRQGRFGSTFGSIGNVAGRFAAPKGLALDSDGNRYVSDGLMDIVQVFDPSGRLLLIVGRNGTGDGEFIGPSGIAIGPDDRIYVVDSINRRIQIFRYFR